MIGVGFVPNVPITESYNASGTIWVMNQDQSPMMISPALKAMDLSIGAFHANIDDWTTACGWPAGTVPDGKMAGEDGFVYKIELEPVPAFWNISGPDPQWMWVGDDTGWEGSIDWSLVASSSHIDRVETIDPQMGSDVGPTHSSEREFADTWEVTEDAASLTVTIGAMTATATDATRIPTPSDGVLLSSTMHKSSGGVTVVYGKFADLKFSNINLVLDGIYKKYSGQEYYLIGRGADIDIETRDYHGVGRFVLSGGITSPHIVDYGSMGVGVWGGYAL